MVQEAIASVREVAANVKARISVVPEKLAHPVYFFGEVAIRGRSENQIPETEMKKYREGFSLMKKMVDSTDDPREKAFLSSGDILKLVLGSDPCTTYEKEEARVIYQALQKVGALKQFLIVDRRMEDWHKITIINREGILSVLRSKSTALGISSDDIPQNIPADKLEDLMLRLLNNQQNYDRNWGIVSRYPNDIIEDFVKNHVASEVIPSGKVNSETQAYLDETERETPLTEASSYYMSPYLSDHLVVSTNPDHPVGLHIAGFGITFFSKSPVSQETTEICQKLLEIDRRLGLRKYRQSVLKKVDTMLLIRKIEGIFKKR